MKSIKLSIVAALLATTSIVTSASAASVSGDVSMTSNSLWRGTSLTNNNATVMGTIGVAFDNGIYASAWGTGLTEGSEIDLSIGYATEVGGIGLDVGYVNYSYSGTAEEKQNFDYGELYLGASYSTVVDLSATIYKGVMEEDEDSTIIQLGLDKDFGAIYAGLSYGVQLDEDSGDDYYSATVGMPFESVKGDLSFTYAQSATTGADAVYALTYTTSF